MRVLLLVLASLAACTSHSGNPCVATSDCAAGQRCVDTVCVERTATRCDRDSDCGPGGTCTDRVCFGGTACQSVDECGPGERCDTTQGLCIVQDCDSRGLCPNGGGCDFLRNRCGAPNVCESNDDCAPPAGRCDHGFCIPGCGKQACPSGSKCNENTGVCDERVTCSRDLDCGAPRRICENSRCVDGCALANTCIDSETCNTETGRCETSVGDCSSDSQCGAPAGICVSNTCVASCAGGGPACTGNTTCNTATGRCDPTGGGCTQDAQCSAPTPICADGSCVAACTSTSCRAFEACDTGRCVPKGCSTDANCAVPAGRCVSNVCIAACGSTGCSGSDTCNATTGACEGGSSGGADGSVCRSNGDCDSSYCHGLEGQDGMCTHVCGTTADCPTGDACLSWGGIAGVRACHFGAGALPPGSRCSTPGDCASGLCVPGNGQGAGCLESCAKDGHCASNQHCSGIGQSPSFTQVCQPAIPGLVDQYPAECLLATTGELNCASTFCDGSGSYCFSGCCKSTDCPVGSVCFPQQPYWLGDGNQSTTLMLGCMPAPLGRGQDPIGANCSLTGGANDGFNCRSNFCIGNYADGVALPSGQGYCSDTCCSDRDCGTGYACIAASIDATTAFGVCARIAH